MSQAVEASPARPLSSGSRLGRLRIRLGDRVRHSPILRWTGALSLALAGLASRSRATRLERWAAAHRICVGLGLPSPTARWLGPELHQDGRCEIWLGKRIGWDRYGRGAAEGGTLGKSLLLRAPTDAQPGVMMVWFEYDLLTLLSAPQLSELLARYRIVFCGSWSPPYYPALWSIPKENRPAFLAGLSHPDDAPRLRSLGLDLEILPLYMSSWQNPDDFHPLPASAREVDLVMVANWARFKRHWLLFDALRRLRRPEIRCVLIGQPEQGRGVAELRREAEAFGVAGQITFLDRLPVDEVWGWLARARASLVCSRREGSCVVVAESLMADTPVGLLAGADIGSRRFIGPETGRFLEEGPRFASQLAAFLEEHASFRPRDWAIRHIAKDLSRKVLEERVGAVAGFSCRGTLQLDAPPTPEHAAALADLGLRHKLFFPLHRPVSPPSSAP